MRPDPSKGETVEGFQVVAVADEHMQEQGLISISFVHEVFHAGRKVIDAIQFVRLE